MRGGPAQVTVSTQRPATLREYIFWLRDSHKVVVDDRTERYYDAVTRKMRGDFEASALWLGILGELQEWNDEYARNGYPLLLGFDPALVPKPYASFLMKTFRKNCVRNDNWPGAPAGGWLLPVNWYSDVHDLVRTLLVVKYLDGVEFAMKKLLAYLDDNGIEAVGTLEARVEGYYAAHVVLSQDFEIPREDWDTTHVTTGVEIQVTTQLQEVMRAHLHEYYDERRLQEPTDLVAWQWNYRTPEFSTGYLAHILHYVEGMIVEIRDKQRKERS
jgi:hypothetical protein